MFNLFNRGKKTPAQLFYHTDVHCHILPGVDHGSQNVEQSLAMLQAELDMGVNRVVCTSHVTSQTFENTVDSLTHAYEELVQAVKEAELEVEIFASAEYRVDEYFNKEYAAGNILPMPGNFLLLENSFQQELLELDELLFDCQLKGYKPMLAHPERYSYYARRHQRLTQLHNNGVKFQLNILSLTGFFGAMARETAVWLIKNNMVDFLGSDMHSVEQAEIIQRYLKSKDWRKQSALLDGRILNDGVR